MCLQVRRRNESCSRAERRGWKERRREGETEREREREKERIAVEFEFDATRAKITRGYIRSKYIGILYRRIDNRFKKNNSEISLYLEASD